MRKASLWRDAAELPDREDEFIRWKLTDDEKARIIKECPKCGSKNLDPANGWNSANGQIKCYDCGHGPFWWLKPRSSEGTQ